MRVGASAKVDTAAGAVQTLVALVPVSIVYAKIERQNHTVRCAGLYFFFARLRFFRICVHGHGDV